MLVNTMIKIAYALTTTVSGLLELQAFASVCIRDFMRQYKDLGLQKRGMELEWAFTLNIQY